MNGKERKVKQHIQVFARIRPFNNDERMHNATQYMQVNGKDITIPQAHNSKRFTFDKVFDMHSKQMHIYKEAINPIIQEVLKGYNCTVFAYGQTGSGKTHTMVGPELAENLMTFSSDSDAGIIPRAMGHIFDCLSTEKELDYTIRASYLEIYNEVLNDLLSSDDKILRIYEDPKNKSSVQIHGLEEVTVYNKRDVYQLLRMGSEKRKMAATYMNQQSSRSHTVFTITVHMKETTPEGEELVKTGKLNLVDLAGSENIQRSGAVDQRAREAGSINQSLLTLGRAIKALVDKAGHVPYRESKLTRILQDSLGGKTKTTIIATASPAISNMEETLSTLDYAYRARNIITKPEVNQRLCKTALIKGYLEEIDRLKKDLLAARKGEGFYLNADSYHNLVQENVTNREEYLRAVKECTEFETRAGELQRQCTQLEEVFSVTQQDLRTAKDTLQRSRLYLKHLRRDRHIRQELIDKYAETESQHFRASKEVCGVLDAHIREHNVLRDKLDRFYASMELNENAAGCFAQEQRRLGNIVEDLCDAMHESLTQQLHDTKKLTNEFMQKQCSSIEQVENTSSVLVSSYIESIDTFAQHMQRRHAAHLQALEESSNLSKETMQILKQNLNMQYESFNDGLAEVCTYGNKMHSVHHGIFMNWKDDIQDLKKHVQDKCNSNAENIQSILNEATECMQQFAQDISTVRQPMADAAVERAALQVAIDKYMKRSDELHDEHNNIVDRLVKKGMKLPKPISEKWKVHENEMKSNAVAIQSMVDNISKTVTNGIEVADNTFNQLPVKLEAICEENKNENETFMQLITESTQNLCDLNHSQNQQALVFKEMVAIELETTRLQAVEGKAQCATKIQTLQANLTSYVNAHSSKVSGIVETLKGGLAACSNGLAEMAGIVKGFVASLHAPKPSGGTPSHKNSVMYELPRKLSTRVLQYPDLDLSSISLLDESVDLEAGGRPSLEFYDASDADIEYRGQFVTTQIRREKCSPVENSLDSNGNNSGSELG